MHIKTLFLSFILAASFTSSAEAVTLTFDDVSIGELADGYGGISGWSQIGSVYQSWGEGLGENLFYGSMGEIRFDNGPVVFEGSYYKAYAIDTNNPVTSFSLFYQGELVHTILDPLAPLQLEWVASGYSGLVDKIYIRGGGEGFAIDNFKYSQASTVVPEPATPLLLLAGLGTLTLTRRKKTRMNRSALEG